MLWTLAAMGSALMGGLVFSGTEVETHQPEPEDETEIEVQDDLIAPISDGPDPYFDEFRPGTDTLVVTYPDELAKPGFEALSLSYDEDFDETEVMLELPDGPKLVCYLPGVTPDMIGPENVDFVSQSAAAAELSGMPL